MTGPLRRWRHPAFLIFFLGGILGAALNYGSTLLLALGLSLDPLAAFFMGTLLNQVFHYFYYHVVYVNEEIRMRTSLPLHLGLSLTVAGTAALLLGFFLGQGWSLSGSVLACLLLLSFSNGLLNRISTFSSARLADVEYRELEGDFYDEQSDSERVSRFRAWYHRSRFDRLAQFVGSRYRKGMRIADLGCGNCRWNLQGLPVTGVDVNAKMLRWARKKGRLRAFRVSPNLGRTGLPDKNFDLVVMSEVLEHLADHRGVLKEVGRILKDRGTFLITVPYDFFLGPFFLLFNLNCLYMAYVKGSVYHKYRCGHVHHFTKGRLRATLQENGFELERIFVVNGLLLYASARKAGPRMGSGNGTLSLKGRGPAPVAERLRGTGQG